MLAKYGLAPSKQRGQNFLSDANVTRKVVSAAGLSPDDVVVEIGPGFGALTFGLAEAARHVVAVEIDAGIARAFRDEYGGPRRHHARGGRHTGLRLFAVQSSASA